MSQVFPHHVLVKKPITLVIVFFKKSRYGEGRPETCINVHFRAWNARLYISQVFFQHILIKKKNNLKNNCFFFHQFLVGEDLRQAWKRVSGPETHVYARLRCSLTIFWLKNQFIKILFFFKSKSGGGRPETCTNVHFRAWNARLYIPQVFFQHILI